MKLTEKKIAKLEKPGRYLDAYGLHLQITSSGTKSWLLRYTRHGRERWMGLGPQHTIDLKEARELAIDARRLLLKGIDPIDARKAERALQALEEAKALTFEQAARQFFDTHSDQWRNPKHRAQFLSSLEAYAFPILGKLSVAAIDTGLILKVIEPIWKEKTETASRVRNRIERVLDWATVRGFRKGDNPARWKGHLKSSLPAREKLKKVKHHAALPYAEIPAFMSALREQKGISASALEFTILTAARTGETIGAKWPEIDLVDKIWVIPADRMKAGREHRVPLSDRVIEILGELHREDGNPFVFIAPNRSCGLSNMAMAKVLERMERTDITVHGFRSTFRDWAADQTNYQSEVVEMALAHSISNKVEAAYRRGTLLEKRARLMNEWNRYCLMPIQNAEVVQLITKSAKFAK